MVSDDFDDYDTKPDDEPDAGVCKECGQECRPVRRDFGIGPYEYWGSRGVDTNYQWVSPCCECDIMDPEEYAAMQEGEGDE